MVVLLIEGLFKVIFTARVRSKREGNIHTWECLSVHYRWRGVPNLADGGYPIPGPGGGGYPIQLMGGGGFPDLGGGYPIQLTRGYPIQLMGVPHSRYRWGAPHSRSRQGGTPSSLGQGWYPIPGMDGGTLGYPHPRLNGVLDGWMEYLPVQDCMGYPPPPQRLDGVPPPPLPPHKETDQQSEHLLRGERYASCVHAGGLICFSSFHATHQHLGDQK